MGETPSAVILFLHPPTFQPGAVTNSPTWMKKEIISSARRLASISPPGKMLRTNWEGTAIQPCSRSWKAGQEFRKTSAVCSRLLSWPQPSLHRLAHA